MYILLIYGFPIILLVFEWGLRYLLKVDTHGFIGPTLAAAGLSFLVPLTKPKALTIATGSSGVVMVTPRREFEFIAFIWMLVLAYLFVWAATCVISVAHPQSTYVGYSIHSEIGAAAYVVSLAMTFLKEKI